MCRDAYSRAWYFLYAVIAAQLACTLLKAWFVSFKVLTKYMPVNALKYATHVRVRVYLLGNCTFALAAAMPLTKPCETAGILQPVPPAYKYSH